MRDHNVNVKFPQCFRSNVVHGNQDENIKIYINQNLKFPQLGMMWLNITTLANWEVISIQNEKGKYESFPHSTVNVYY